MEASNDGTEKSGGNTSGDDEDGAPDVESGADVDDSPEGEDGASEPWEKPLPELSMEPLSEDPLTDSDDAEDSLTELEDFAEPNEVLIF